MRSKSIAFPDFEGFMHFQVCFEFECGFKGLEVSRMIKGPLQLLLMIKGG